MDPEISTTWSNQSGQVNVTSSFTPETETSYNFTNESFASTNHSSNYYSTREEEIGRMIYIVGTGILIPIGTLGNILSFSIMTRSSLNKLSTSFFMAMLALADTGKLFESVKRLDL